MSSTYSSQTSTACLSSLRWITFLLLGATFGGVEAWCVSHFQHRDISNRHRGSAINMNVDRMSRSILPPTRTMSLMIFTNTGQAQRFVLGAARPVPSFPSSSSSSLQLAASNEIDSSSSSSSKTSKLPFYLDPGTKGGALVWMSILFLVPILIYNVVVRVGGVDEIQAGIWIGISFTVLATLAWVSTYLFRVATKDMTYAKQLKDYENAVIAKRLAELDEDELQALVEEVERDDF